MFLFFLLKSLILFFKMTMIEIYRDALRKRRQRHRCVKRYGLLRNKEIDDVVSEELSSKGFKYYQKLKVLAQFMNQENFDKYFSQLDVCFRLKDDVKKLQNLRKLGIKTLEGGLLHVNLYRQRRAEEKKIDVSRSRKTYLQLSNCRSKRVISPVKTKSHTRFEIVDMFFGNQPRPQNIVLEDIIQEAHQVLDIKVNIRL